MGLPKDNVNGYKNGSVLEFVDRFPSEYVFIYRPRLCETGFPVHRKRRQFVYSKYIVHGSKHQNCGSRSKHSTFQQICSKVSKFTINNLSAL